MVRKSAKKTVKGYTGIFFCIVSFSKGHFKTEVFLKKVFVNKENILKHSQKYRFVNLVIKRKYVLIMSFHISLFAAILMKKVFCKQWDYFTHASRFLTANDKNDYSHD